MRSKIIISDDFNDIKNELEIELKHNVKFFISDDFLIENANNVINEAYISEEQDKLLVLMAKSFRIEAQNSLLKVIEEPPRNIFFYIVAPSKNALLPTICSRLIVEYKNKKRKKISSGLNLRQLELKEIYNFIQTIETKERSDGFGKNELKEILSVIILEALEAGFKFSEDELSYFYKIVNLASLNSKAHSILTPLLLNILNKSKK
ncbi:DNA polymerase III, delta prime subunit [Campylobacter pinnipediorum subsp. pinnipediorum]|uniref:DNA polymerase III subunit delta' n=1 Tax=Campylobacter pinnipediorum TaxID=1965231 RepID=UPI00099575A0|nr:DNA polymerase III subunit delta' [Campylobacter pinnipediorum]AQW81520.1 DNA polymerase III, delta prime subunit [Campylobacter pinnipediorum subsp. pinnipediorum]